MIAMKKQFGVSFVLASLGVTGQNLVMKGLRAAVKNLAGHE